ncbi:MAG: CAP domain-containing protein, partial [Rhodospirillales bacterium]|nr:CAP domain-containing protein [Rhodospirillales bacterium]
VFKGTWKESPGHNKNLLLTDAEHMGIALVQDPKTEFKTFWTLVVGSPL